MNGSAEPVLSKISQQNGYALDAERGAGIWFPLFVLKTLYYKRLHCYGAETNVTSGGGVTNENARAAVEEVLGKPVAAELSDAAQRVRRNLLLVSSIVIVMTIGRAKLASDSPVLGFRFTGLTDETIQLGLLVVVGYLLLHFLWYAVEGFVEWKLRVTGCRTAFITGSHYESEHKDFPSDPRQSTLYNWWRQEAKRIGDINERLVAMEASSKESEKALRCLVGEPNNFECLTSALNQLNDVHARLTDVRTSVDRTREVLASIRIPTSLERFDSWFFIFLRLENLRWLLIDALFPLLTGGFAIVLLIRG